MSMARFRFGKKKDNVVEDEYNDPPKPFMAHLIDLRTCLVRCAIAWLVCVLAIIPFAPTINSWIMAPANITPQELGITVEQPADAKDGMIEGDDGKPVAVVKQNEPVVQVQGLSWTVGCSVILKIMMLGGTALAMPFLLFFIMQFVFPGLKRSEKNVIVFTLVSSSVFFIGGVAMAYATTLRIALTVFLQINRWMNIPTTIITMEEHTSIVIKTIVAFGLAFQLPLLVLALGWIGIISAKAMAEKRRIAIVLIFVIAMLLTPPDPLSQLMMALPMCLLYELCIWIIRFREKARRSS